MASEKITGNDLDFSIEDTGGDELGRLCASFEIMRSTLAENFSQMWRQADERKRLNAAFAHDLRTPLTVLKGYDEMLQTSEDPRTQRTAAMMETQILRLERYVDSMSGLQRLEDAQPGGQMVPLQELLGSLAESAQMLCQKNGKKLEVQNRTAAEKMAVDPEFLGQVCNNLMANAVRYAGSAVVLSFEEEGDGLRLSVSDDGTGFSKEALSQAADPYFTEEKHAQHLGLGLSICKILCQRHGGDLRIQNGPTGAKVSAFFKSSPCR